MDGGGHKYDCGTHKYHHLRTNTEVILVVRVSHRREGKGFEKLALWGRVFKGLKHFGKRKGRKFKSIAFFGL